MTFTVFITNIPVKIKDDLRLMKTWYHFNFFVIQTWLHLIPGGRKILCRRVGMI